MGIAGVEAEVEIISLAHALMKALGAKDEDFVIKIGDRRIIEKALRVSGVKEDDIPSVFRLLDKKGKMPEEERLPALETLGYAKNKIISYWSAAITDLQKRLTDEKINNVEFDESIVRGFDYYTGMVFEVFDTHAENRRSLFGGGRYDNLLEVFGVEPVPTVGFGMGDVTIRDFLETHQLPMKYQSTNED